MASLEAGRRLADRYLLQERLGDGGHAEVWAARDELNTRIVALKFLHLRTCSADEALQALRHEAQMAQRLDHPGVLHVDEPLRDGELVFLPIEYASGGDAARLRGAPWTRVLPVLLDVASVLEHAHSRGVVHRDIKPGNVLFDAAGAVRLADFGASARTGCAAPAAGSPFSASPQQLQGDAATTADDVYGLGALTYELLTSYPPFYPRFDAEQIRSQDPPPPQPVHPAPAALLSLVQAMLARDAAARPDIRQVIQGFEACMAAGPAAVADAVVIEAAAADHSTKTRLSIGAGWWLAAAAGLGGAVLFWLPDPKALTPVVEIKPEVAPVVRVADAVVAPASTDQASTDPAPALPSRTPLADELRAGAAALAALQPAQARGAFQRVLAQQPEHAEALAGMTAAARLEGLLAVLAEGTRAEAQGDLATATARFQSLLLQQADFAPAHAALARVQARQRDMRFENLLAVGAAALRTGDVPTAQAAYRDAALIHPQEPRVLDAEQRIAEIVLSRRNAEDMATGAGLEQQERWDASVAHYRQVVERDAGLRFAQDGLARSERRAALDQELQDYLQRPERLTAAAVRTAAERAVARGEASAADAPRLQAQLRDLRTLLGSLNMQARVSLQSDDSTQVTVAQVGDLGRFVSHELQLPPGQYTVIGRRDGYRDVRHELKIAPGQRDVTLSVLCTERI